MDTDQLRILDDLAAAADAGDRHIRTALPLFNELFHSLLTDPIARNLEPGSVGHTARLFALRKMAEASSAYPAMPHAEPAEPR